MNTRILQNMRWMFFVLGIPAFLLALVFCFFGYGSFYFSGDEYSHHVRVQMAVMGVIGLSFVIQYLSALFLMPFRAMERWARFVILSVILPLSAYLVVMNVYASVEATRSEVVTLNICVALLMLVAFVQFFPKSPELQQVKLP